MPGEYLQYGGQAIVEGVMMRSPNYFAVACRAPDGSIVTSVEPLEKTWIGRQKWLKAPFLRGSLAILDAMALGSKAMRFAGNVQLQGEGDATPPKKVQETSVGLALVSGIAIGFLIFNYLPNVLGESIHNHLGNTDYRLTNLIVEFLKMALFFGYIYGIGRLPEIGRVFMYHGAEHKAINTLEAEQELNLDNCRAQTRLHPRCGTSFAIVVLLVSMLVFTFVPRYPVEALRQSFLAATAVRFVLEIAMLPIVAGISYELIRLAGRFRDETLVKALFWPGLMTQYLTTKEPDAAQIEVALASLKLVVEAEAAP
jgi:uncharacterized protein YqhQ